MNIFLNVTEIIAMTAGTFFIVLMVVAATVLIIEEWRS